MAEQWRFVDLGAQTPFENVSQMPVLGQYVNQTNRPVMTTSVWGATHLNVGWFDDIDSTLDLEACKRLGVQVIRRPMYGGGTAFYQEDCAVMWGFLLPRDAHPNLDEELARFQPVVLDALAALGLGEVQFEGSSDLRWNGRKLGALTAQDVVLCNTVGGFINTRPPDIDLYLKVVRIPDEKFKDKVVKDMREYVVTAEQIAGHPVSYDQFRDALLKAVATAGIDVSAEPLTDEERSGMAEIAEKVGSERMLRRVSSERFASDAPEDTKVGFGNHKGRKLCRAGVALDDNGQIVAAMMAGDMHVSPPDTMKRIAQALVGGDSSDLADVRGRIAAVFDGEDVHQADAMMGITTDDLVAAVEKAVSATGAG
jgi:lipoate---protein ligase